MDQAVKAMANREGKYLTFVLVGEEYGIGILKVKEVIGIMAITTVPQTPAYMTGVINLRGKVIPIVDLRVKFGMEAVDYTEKTCIIVVEIANSGQNVMIGIPILPDHQVGQSLSMLAMLALVTGLYRYKRGNKALSSPAG